jgi:hypothetical protein
MRKLLSNLLPGREFGTLLVVGARAGCERQYPHTDFDVATFGRDCEHLPMGVFIALQKGTKLDVFTGAHKSVRDKPSANEVKHPKTLQLDRGDVAVIRGDLPHNGSAYDVDNARLFAYVLQPGQRDDYNLTFPVDFSAYETALSSSSDGDLDDSTDGLDTPERGGDALNRTDNARLSVSNSVLPTRYAEHWPTTPRRSRSEIVTPPPITPTRTTRAETNTSHPQIDMFKLASDGYLLITDFISMKPSLFAILVRSLTQNALSLFTPESAEIFNQEREGANDGRRRMTSLGEWLTATSNQLEAPDLIRRLTVAVQRIIRALPEGYRPEDLTKEIRIIRSAAGCLQQAAHTDYETDHADFGHFDTPPLSLFFAISTGAKLVLWDQPPHASSPQARTIEFRQGQAILLLGTKTHSGAAYDQENFRGFMYIHKSTYSPPDPRVTYAPRAACPRRPQPTAGRPPEPEEHTPPQEPCESSDGDLDDYSGDGLDTPERSEKQHFLQLEKAPTVDSID